MKRLILFDIDGTIVRTGGVGKRALTRALSESFNVKIEAEHMDLSGKTDPQICREMLTESGHSLDIDALADMFEIYLPILEQEIANSKDFGLHLGVRELLAELERLDTACVGLLTGNIERGARIKLEPFNLNPYFDFGAYGSDSPERNQLPALAVTRARDQFGIDFLPHETVIIGDSIRDVACAKYFGARCLAVSTGKTSKEELKASGADFLFSSLEPTEKLVAAIFA